MDGGRISAILADCLGEADDEGVEVVDAWLEFALKTAKVKEHEPEMIKLLRSWPTESWGAPIPPLGEEISYIAAGLAINSQYDAFMLFAFGKVLGWWQVLDPCSVLGLDKNSHDAQEMVRKGYVSVKGYTPAEPSIA